MTRRPARSLCSVLRSSLAAGLALASALTLGACANDGAPTGTLPLSTLSATASPTAVTCTAGTQAMVALATPATTGAAVSYAFAAASGAISVTGRSNTVTVSCLTAGSSAITYTLTRGSEIATGTIPVTVTSSALLAPTPLTITLAPNPVACVAGQRVSVRATVSGIDGSATPVIGMASSSGNVIVTSDGVGTASILCLGPGTATLTVTATAGNQFGNATGQILVDAPLAVTASPASIACTPREIVPVGLTISNATGAPTVTYRTTDTSVVTVAGDGARAQVTCGTRAGTARIGFTVTVGGQTVTDSIPVTVTLTPAPPTPLVVTATPTALRCAPGQSTTFTLTVTGGAGDPVLAYTARTAAVTVTGTGFTPTVVCGTTAGATAVDYVVTSGTQTVRGSVPVTIEAAPVVSTLAVTPNPASLSCFPGQTQTVTLTITGGNDIPRVSAIVGNGNIAATTSPNGQTITVLCAAPGASALTIAVASGSQTVVQTVPVTIGSPFSALSISPTSLSVAQGATGQLTATLLRATGAPTDVPQTVTWSTSDASLVTVNASGLVTAVGAVGRQAVITATSTADPSLRASVPVTIVTPTLVASLAVSPSSVAILAGTTQQLTSTVTLATGAPAGTSTAATYTSSDTSIARVSATGLVTAGAHFGTAVITVASVAAPSTVQQVGVTVTVPRPARITVQNVEYVDGLGNLVPVDLNNVSGRIIVTLNVDPGMTTPDSIVAFIARTAAVGAQRTVCQRFSARLAQAMRTTLQSGSADFSPVQCIINTAAFDTTTGAVVLQNGLAELRGFLFYHSVTGTSSQTASAGLPLFINNASGYFLRAANTPTIEQVQVSGNATGQATGPQGVLWRAGTILARVIPVQYAEHASPAAATTVSLVDNLSGGLVADAPAVPGTSGSPLTAYFIGGGETATDMPPPGTPVGTVIWYTTPLVGSGTPGTRVAVSGPLGSNLLSSQGTPLGSTGGPLLFIDNTPPEQRAQFVSENYLFAGRPSGFINAAFSFADSVHQGATTTPLGDRNGVGRVVRTFYFDYGATTRDPNQTVSTPALRVTTGGDLTPNSSTDAYIAVVRLADALGNVTPVPVTARNGGPRFTFGVITAPPALATVGTSTPSTSELFPNSQIGFSAGGRPQLLGFSATSPVGAPFPENFVVGRLQFANASSTVCATSADVVSGTLTGVSPNGPAACPTLAFNSVRINPAVASSGLYSFIGYARDVAGNLSAPLLRLFVIDESPPQVGSISAVTAPLTGGQPETLQAPLSDDLKIVDQFALVRYATAAGGTTPAIPEILLRYGDATLNTPFSFVFTRNTTYAATISTFIRAIAVQRPSALNEYTGVANQTFVTTDAVAVGVSDGGRNWTYGHVSGLPLDATAGQSTPPALFGTVQGPVNASIRYLVTSAIASTVTTTPPEHLARATYGTPTTVRIDLVQNGRPGTPFVSPFTKIEVYQRGEIPGATPFTSRTAYKLFGTFGGASITTSPSASTIVNSFTIAPGVNGIPNYPYDSAWIPLDLLVVASDANGYAAAFVIPTITLVTFF